MEVSSAAVERRPHLASRPSLEQMARACGPGPGDMVFISGSRLEGFGNSQSDYDMYVIQQEKGQARPFVTVVLDESYVVYETFAHAQILRIADTLNGVNPEDFRTFWSLSWFELELYYRVLIGRGLVNERAFEELKTRFHKTVIDACVHVWCGLRARVHLEEAERKMAVGKHSGAYTSAQQAISAAADAFLAARGESYPGWKWRFEKLRRAVGESDQTYRRVWDLKSLGARTVPEYVAEVKSLADDLGMQKFHAWSLGDTVCKPGATARAMTVRGVAYLIDNKNALYELTPDGARVWGWIDGSITRRDLTGRATTETGMSPREVDAFVFTLAEHGLIV